MSDPEIVKPSSVSDPLDDLFAFSRDVLDYPLLTGLHIKWFQALLENPHLMLWPRGISSPRW